MRQYQFLMVFKEESCTDNYLSNINEYIIKVLVKRLDNFSTASNICHMYIKRIVDNLLTELFSQYQVGKTTVLEHVFPDIAYVSLDYIHNAEQAETRTQEFLDRFGCPLIIDEIQYAPKLLRHIKTRVDAEKNKKGLYLITGSQSFPLMKAISESLAERAVIINMYGLSFTEWESINSGAKPIDYLFRGSFPALWNNPEKPLDRDRWYQSYVTTYLERDVRNILNIGRMRDFERFIRACAFRTGQTLNMSDLARDVGIAPSTAREWISVLEALHQIMLLKPYFESRGKRLVKSPKLYFYDTGLALFLAGFSSTDALLSSPAVGAFWENHVISQWLRWKHWEAPASTLWYWQNQQKLEVDLVIEHNGRLYPIECKFKETPDDRDCRGLRAFQKMYPKDRLGEASIACLSTTTWNVQEGIVARPGWTPWKLE